MVDILAFGAHPDDVEISCSGTLIKHISLGLKVVIIDLTKGELGTGGDAEIRKKESVNAAKKMNITQRVNLNIPDGFIYSNKENIIKIVEQIRYFKPKIIFANAIEDRHPDHSNASKLVNDSLFYSGLIKFETFFNSIKQEPWRPSQIYFYIQDNYIIPNLVIDISPFINQKMEVLNCFKSQFYSPNSNLPITPINMKNFMNFIQSRAADMGRYIYVDFAEGFNTKRPIGLDNILNIF